MFIVLNLNLLVKSDLALSGLTNLNFPIALPYIIFGIIYINVILYTWLWLRLECVVWTNGLGACFVVNAKYRWKRGLNYFVII